MHYSATYSPDDNKLRLYASARLDAETYARVKAAGFKWAPKQDLFFAPMWTPSREDLLIELAGEIGDEDTSLTDRAEQRAERFEGYSGKRTADANRARAAVDAICEFIPLGQPILVGHHSEKHARRDAQRIENGMRRAVKMWETADYWKDRAAGAISHARYKERPDVRARRIKGIEADKRKAVKDLEAHRHKVAQWRKVLEITNPDTQHKAALMVANVGCYWSMCFPLDKYPRNPPASQYEGAMGLWSALDGGVITAPQAAEIALRGDEAYQARAARWIAHYDNRLAYEGALLASEGYVEPPKRASKAVLPLLNYPGTIECRSPYRAEVMTLTAHHMTKAEYAKIYDDYKGTMISADKTHRIRSALIGDGGRRSLCAVFITDTKQHDPAKEGDRIAAATAKLDKQVAARAAVLASNRAILDGKKSAAPAPVAVAVDQGADIEAMRASLKTGVKVVAVPQLFATPRDLAQRVADLADILPGNIVLEPSAGTGALLGAMGGRMFSHNPDAGAVFAVEINPQLAERLAADFPLTTVHCGDFLQWTPAAKFDRIAMNPPFKDGLDIRHIQHARAMLAPGGRLVAICANGPRQRAALMADAEEWEDLPAGSFKDQGTNVSAALVVYTGPQAAPRPVPSELTPVGEQFVIPGCERQPGAGKAAQLDLWHAAGKVAAQ